MTEATRYQYEKRIKELEFRISQLEPYRALSLGIASAVTNAIGDGKQISHAWIVRQFFDRVMK